MRLANCSWNGAALWNVVQPLEQCLMLRNWEVAAALRHKYGCSPVSCEQVNGGGVWFCRCGMPVDAGHNHRCRAVMGPATFHRHQTVVAELRSIAEVECGLSVDVVPRVYSDVIHKDEDSYVMPDIVMEGADFKLAIDVSGVYGESPSYVKGAGKLAAVGKPLTPTDMSELRSEAAIATREAKKKTHYSGLVEKDGECDFLPFVFESHGGLGGDASTVLQRMALYACERNGSSVLGVPAMCGYFRRRIAIAIQRGNAALDSVARSKQRGSFASLLARGFASASASSASASDSAAAAPLR